MAVLGATLPAGTADAADPSSTIYRDIYVIQPDGTGRQQITTSYDYNADPAWSPNGDRIAFVRALYELNSNVWVMSASGGQQVNVTNLACPASTQSPTWAPSGTQIVYGSTQGARIVFTSGSHLMVMNANGSGQQVLTNTGSPNNADW